jgi:Ras-related protein Rab-5C
MAAHKVMLLGEIGVGKSSLARRLVFDRFSRDYKPTIGVEVYRYDIPAERAGVPTSLILWDTDGNFGDAIFRHVYIKEATAALIVGDPTRPDTIDSMVRLARGFAEVLPGRFVHFILNKSDLPEAATGTAELSGKFASQPGPLTRTSALSGDHVADAFLSTALAIRRRGQ